MAIYVALLRGINVGNNTLKMERLRELWTGLGFTNVQTYIQSGNVVFEARGDVAKWMPDIQRSLIGETRLPIVVVVRSATDLAAIVAANSFLENAGIDRSKLHVTFLERQAGKDAITKLMALRADGEEISISAREIYLHCPAGYGKTKLSNTAIERALAMKATTRNWNTVNKLHAMATPGSEDGHA